MSEWRRGIQFPCSCGQVSLMTVCRGGGGCHTEVSGIASEMRERLERGCRRGGSLKCHSQSQGECAEPKSSPPQQPKGISLVSNRQFLLSADIWSPGVVEERSQAEDMSASGSL